MKYNLTFRRCGVTEPKTMAAAHALRWVKPEDRDVIFDVIGNGATMGEAIRALAPKLPGYEFEDGWRMT